MKNVSKMLSGGVRNRKRLNARSSYQCSTDLSKTAYVLGTFFFDFK